MDDLFDWVRQNFGGEEAVMRFEYHLYNAASRYIDGYMGGMWTTEKLNTRASILYYNKTKRVRLINPMNYTDLETDCRTACAAMTVFALYGMYSENQGHKNCRKLVSLMDAIKSKVGSDKTFDGHAFYKVID